MPSTLWQLPLYRGFGRKGEGWGDGQYVSSGDHIEKFRLYWVVANQTKQSAKSTWDLVMVVQFTDGTNLVSQNAKVLYGYTDAMLQKRSMLSELDGSYRSENFQETSNDNDDGWWLTNHIGDVGIQNNWLPAKLEGDPDRAVCGEDWGRFKGFVRLDTKRARPEGEAGVPLQVWHVHLRADEDRVRRTAPGDGKR